ncbi:hypothetical protein PT2222_80017 [Paraburkholderia tropica]
MDSASSHEDTPPCRRNGARRHAAGAPGNGAAKEVRDPGMAAIELTETVCTGARSMGGRPSNERYGVRLVVMFSPAARCACQTWAPFEPATARVR